MVRTPRRSLVLATVGVVSVGLWPIVAVSAASSPEPSALEGTWVAETTCEQQNAALAKAGIKVAPEILAKAEIDQKKRDAMR